MIFVDFYDARSATASMRLHQNHLFEGHAVSQGIMIDFDKDPRNKRNRAFTSQARRSPSRSFSFATASISLWERTCLCACASESKNNERRMERRV